jgi:hypothetical protein
VTLEVFEALTALRPVPAIYSFERALQGPYMEIMQRGILVDQFARSKAIKTLHERQGILRELLTKLAHPVWGKDLNPDSPNQVKEFFYNSMGIPPVYLSFKGQRRVSVNREALEKIEVYMHARPFVSIILALRGVGKQLSVLETEIDQDGRMRTSYNICGTETGRPSSSQNAFGTGTNLQNIEPGLRNIFISDPRKKICVIDLEQVEARDVGFFCGCLFDDWTLLDACESGDLHTANARLIWPELGWSSDRSAWRAVADQQFYREFTYRDMAKRGSHLTNYSGTAWTASRSLKVPLPIMEDFQARYCRGGPGITPAYPCIPRYWAWIATELQLHSRLVTPFGRERIFFGRPTDPTTIREAIAFFPQSTTADRMNLGLWRVWKQFGLRVDLLAQTYDSITFQFAESDNPDELIPAILKTIEVELCSPSGRKYIVPGEAKIGWNWGNFDPERNPLGLVKFKPGKSDNRKRGEGLERLAGV